MTANEYTAVFDDIEMALTAKFSYFYPEDKYGTLFFEAENKEQLLACANQGLSHINGAFVKNAVINGREVIFNIFVNEKEGQVLLRLENNC